MLSNKLGHFLDRPLRGIARRIDVSPDVITVCGFFITVFASYQLISNLLIGGILFLVGALFDMLDGVIARANGRSSAFGAFLDSVLDRYSDGLIFCGIALNMISHQNHAASILCFVSLLGAFATSYARARAEGLGVSCREGLIERPERIIILVIGTLTGWIMECLWLLAIGGNVTALQRIFYVRKTLKQI